MRPHEYRASVDPWTVLVSGDADGGAAEAEVVVPAQRDVVGLAGLSLPGVPSTVRAALEAELAKAGLAEIAEEAELAELAEIAEETELGRDSGGGEAGGGFGGSEGSEGSGLGVHLRSVGGASREHGVPCGVCLVETWNVCAICDSCHSECRLAR